MAKWVLMTDPATGNVGLYDEPTPAVTEDDYENPDAPCNAPLNDPLAYMAYVYWHIQFDNLEKLFDTSVVVNHTAIGTSSIVSDSGLQNAFDMDDATVAFDVYTHNAGYPPLVLVIFDGNKALIPGYPVQVPTTPTGATRYVTPYVTDTKVFLHEFRARSGTGLAAQSIPYRIVGFREQRPAEGNTPPRLIDVDTDTGLVTLGDGRWRNDRDYLKVDPEGTSPIGLPYGRTAAGAGGGIRVGKSDGTYVDPIPNNYIRQAIYTSGRESPIPYGAASYYDGSWIPDEVLQVVTE